LGAAPQLLPFAAAHRQNSHCNSDAPFANWSCGPLQPPLPSKRKSVSKSLQIPTEQVWQTGKFRQIATARSLLCYWSVHELGELMMALGKRLGILTATVSKFVRRGAQSVKEKELTLGNLGPTISINQSKIKPRQHFGVVGAVIAIIGF
jgi:hypothetical protein